MGSRQKAHFSLNRFEAGVVFDPKHGERLVNRRRARDARRVPPPLRHAPKEPHICEAAAMATEAAIESQLMLAAE